MVFTLRSYIKTLGVIAPNISDLLRKDDLCQDICDIFVNINLVLQQFDIMTLNFFVFTEKKSQSTHVHLSNVLQCSWKF